MFIIVMEVWATGDETDDVETIGVRESPQSASERTMVENSDAEMTVQ